MRSDKPLPLAVSSYALEHKVLNAELFDPDEQIKKEIKVKFLDIPKVHDYESIEGEEFFMALQDAEDFAIFECNVIKYLIEFRNPLTMEYIMKKNFYPFLIYMFSLVFYINLIFPMMLELRKTH